MNRQKTADQSYVRELNTSIVMDCIRLRAPISRADLAARTGLNRSTISLIIDELIDRGFVRETTRQDSKIGRPGILLQFDPNGGFAVGVEIGVDFLSVILTNFIGEVLWRNHQTIDQKDGQIAILERAENYIEEALKFGKELGLRPLGIGVGIPGLVDARLGKLVFAPNLRWTDVPIRLIWMRRFNLPVFVENEANCAALGEYFYGVAHDVKDFVFLKTGVGLGGGIMIGGSLFRGASGFAGEIGHMTLYADGEQCGCGRKGCWETYVRPSSLLNEVSRRLKNGEKSVITDMANQDPDDVTMEMVVQAAQQNDPVALSGIENLGGHLAVGISNLINVFNPELVVLGGALSLTSRWLIPVINASLESNILPPLRRTIRIESSSETDDACLLGAIALVLDDILREPLNAV